MEESRSRVQQASEALEQGQLSQAVTEGTRAGRQLSELRDQFRQQAANRFSEEMTEMRREARKLDEQQQQLSEQLNEQNDTRPAARSATLASGPKCRKVLTEQRAAAGRLLEQCGKRSRKPRSPSRCWRSSFTTRFAKRTSSASTMRSTWRGGWWMSGIEREAGRGDARRRSRASARLRQGVERAAESVLGDETEALRRAQQRSRSTGRGAEPRNRPSAVARISRANAISQAGRSAIAGSATRSPKRRSDDPEWKPGSANQ